MITVLKNVNYLNTIIKLVLICTCKYLGYRYGINLFHCSFMIFASKRKRDTLVDSSHTFIFPVMFTNLKLNTSNTVTPYLFMILVSDSHSLMNKFKVALFSSIQLHASCF